MVALISKLFCSQRLAGHVTGKVEGIRGTACGSRKPCADFLRNCDFTFCFISFLKVFRKPCVHSGNRVRVPRIRPAVRARPLRNVDFPFVFKVSSGSGTGLRARKPLADSGNRVRIFSGILIFTLFIGVRWEGATPPDYRTAHIFSWARVGGAGSGSRVSSSVRPSVRVFGKCSFS